MKKKLLFLFALICSVSLFSSCGDDDEDTTWTQIPDATKENTNLKINGGSLPDASASLDIQSAEAAVLKLTKAVYGHDDISVNVAMVKSNDSTYVFEGTANLDGAISKATAAVDKGLTVAAKGTVTLSGKLTVEVTTSGWGTLSGVYSGDSLKITVNGEEAKFKRPVTVTAQSETKATLVFEQIPNVVNDFTMEVTLTKEGEGYKIEGNAEKEAGYNIAVSGTIVNNVLTTTITTSGYATFNDTYSGNKLIYTYNGEAFSGVGIGSSSSIALKFKSENTVDITIRNAVAAVYVKEHNQIIVQDVKYTKAADSDTYTFSGTVNPEGFKASTITFEGSLSPEKILTFSANHSIKHDIVGKWSMALTPEGKGKAFFDFQSHAGTITLPDSIYNFVPENMKNQIPQQLSDQELTAYVKQLLGEYTVNLKSIEFKENGNIAIVYNKLNEGSKEYVLEKYMNYSINDNGRLLIAPNFSLLMSGMMSTPASLKSYDPYDATNLLVGDGIQFNIQISGGELRVTLDKGVIVPIATIASELLPILSFLPMIPDNIKEMVPMLTKILSGVTDMLDKEISAFEIGLYLKK